MKKDTGVLFSGFDKGSIYDGKSVILFGKGIDLSPFVRFLDRLKNRKRVYISGPMTGLPDLNFPAFFAEAERQQALGHVVVNPAELNPPGTSWKDCMRRDIEELAGCDAIVMLDGWHLSPGAHLEMHIAHRLEMEIIFAERATP